MGVINPMLHHDENEWPTAKKEAFEYHAQRSSGAIWIIIAIMVAVLGALAYYGYRTVRSQDSRITQMFGSAGTVSALGQRADAVESKVRDLAGDWQGIGQRMTKLEAQVSADARATRRYADTLTQQLHQQITAEMNARTSPLDARLRQVESEQASERDQIAQLEAHVKQEFDSAQQAADRDLSAVREQEQSNARDVNALSQRLDRQRIDFELAKGQTKELAPGISLRIRGVNVSHSRYHGTLTLSQTHRTLWLRDQSAHEPVRFFPQNGGDPYDLVVTDVAKKGVSGYLLAPAMHAPPTGAQVSDAKGAGSTAQE